MRYWIRQGVEVTRHAARFAEVLQRWSFPLSRTSTSQVDAACPVETTMDRHPQPGCLGADAGPHALNCQSCGGSSDGGVFSMGSLFRFACMNACPLRQAEPAGYRTLAGAQLAGGNPNCLKHPVSSRFARCCANGFALVVTFPTALRCFRVVRQ